MTVDNMADLTEKLDQLAQEAEAELAALVAQSKADFEKLDQLAQEAEAELAALVGDVSHS